MLLAILQHLSTIPPHPARRMSTKSCNSPSNPTPRQRPPRCLPGQRQRRAAGMQQRWPGPIHRGWASATAASPRELCTAPAPELAGYNHLRHTDGQQADAAGHALGEGDNVSMQNTYHLWQTFEQEVSHRAIGNTVLICPAQMTFLLSLRCDSALCIFHLLPLQMRQELTQKGRGDRCESLKRNDGGVCRRAGTTGTAREPCDSWKRNEYKGCVAKQCKFIMCTREISLRLPAQSASELRHWAESYTRWSKC